jgi:hypothetical protein
MAAAAAADLRVGIIGTDTSHVIAFTRILNDPAAPEGQVPGAKVVAAFKGGSPDLSYSSGRVEKFANDLVSKYSVEIVPDIPTLCNKVDAILLESVDGRVHLEQFKQVLKAKKPVFIDKPLAASLEDAKEIARLADEAGVPWFSSSSSRFGPTGTSMKFADATGVVVWGVRDLEEKFPLDLSFYAIHSIELLYTLMGPGCEEVRRLVAPDADVITGRWKDGRVGTFYALREPGGSGAVVFRPKAVVHSQPKSSGGYTPLVREIVKFFQTRQSPIPTAEMLEIFAFMDAAQRSKAAGGKPMTLR